MLQSILSNKEDFMYPANGKRKLKILQMYASLTSRNYFHILLDSTIISPRILSFPGCLR